MGMERQFDKRKSNITKGVAILILLAHHVFYNYARGLEFPPMKFFLPKLTYNVANYGALVIFVFAAISGYGIASYMGKKESDIYKCIVQREIGLLETYIPVYIFAVGMCFLFNGNLAFLYETYGDTKRKVLVGALFDMFGVSGLLSTPKLNSTWWYMGAAHCIIVFIPILIKLASLLKSKAAVLIALIVFVGRNQGTSGSALRACVLAAFIGVCMYDGKLIERVDAYFAEKRFGRFFELLLYVVATIIVVFVKEANFLEGYYVWAMTVPFTLFFTNDFLTKIKGVAYLLEKLGVYSGMIFMLHTFVVSIIPKLKNIVYGVDYALAAYLIVLLSSLGISVLLHYILKAVGYYKLVSRIKMGLLAKITRE